MPGSITVVAALIQQDGRLLICQRRKNDTFALKWEFPGGKVRPGESPQAGLGRELREELGVSFFIGPELYRTRHVYSEIPRELELIFFCVKPGPEPLQNLAFERILWAPLAALPGYDFLPADRELILLLARRELQLPGETRT